MIHDNTAVENSVSSAFILQGKALFTVYNSKGQHYTYQVKLRKEDEKKSIFNRWYFASVLVDDMKDDYYNSCKYLYMGVLRTLSGELHVTSKTTLAYNDPRCQVFTWAIQHIWKSQKLPDGCRIVRGKHRPIK